MYYKKNLLFFSHNLDLGGAPIFLLNLIKGGLLDDFNVYLVSPMDGVLKGRFEKLNVNVSIIDFYNKKHCRKLKSYLKFHNIDLVLFNTILMHKVILDLKNISVPFIWVLHESEVDHYLKILKFDKKSFFRCEKVIFVAEATRDLYIDFRKSMDHFEVIHNGF